MIFRTWLVSQLLLLILLPISVTPIVADFRAVYSPVDGFGSRVPNVWEVIHSIGLGGRTRLAIEGVYVNTKEDHSAVFLVVMDHGLWHEWYKAINSDFQSDPEKAWAKSMLICSAPSILRVELSSDSSGSGDNQTHASKLAMPLDFSVEAGFDPDPISRRKSLARPPLTFDFFAFGLYSIHLVTCRSSDFYGQSGQDGSSALVLPTTIVSGRVTIATEAVSVLPDLIAPTSYEQKTTRNINGIEYTSRLHELAYGETLYPTIWLCVMVISAVLLSDWLLTFSGICKARHWRNMLARRRIVDMKLPAIIALSLMSKVIESALKLVHYDRIRQGYPVQVSISFCASIFHTSATSSLFLFLSMGALGIGISRSAMSLKETLLLSVLTSTHFIIGVSQAFCHENESSSAVELPTSTSSMSRRTRKTVYNSVISILNQSRINETGRMLFPDVPSATLSPAEELDQAAAARGLNVDEYYLTSDACNVMIFNEYLLQALIILLIIVGMNFNIATLRQRVRTASLDESSLVLYNKLAALYLIRRSFLMVLISPTILLVVEVMLLSWRYTWLLTLSLEAVSFIIYYTVGKAMFAQGENHFLTRLPGIRGGRQSHRYSSDRSRGTEGESENQDGNRSGMLVRHSQLERRRSTGSRSSREVYSGPGASKKQEDGYEGKQENPLLEIDLDAW